MKLSIDKKWKWAAGLNLMIKQLHIYLLASKYWLQGDSWPDAITYATTIIGRWDK